MPRGVLRTYLFADLRDYTRFVETRGDAAATRLIRGFRAMVRAEIKAARGAEIKTEGDSFYVVFRTPGDAVRCAVGVMRRARRQAERDPDFPIRAAIGINSGEAVKHDKGYVGSAVIVAARLSAQAEAGRIIVTDTVRSLIRTGAIAPMRDLGSWKLKNVTQSVHVFEVELEPLRTSAPEALGPELRMPGVLAPPPLQGATGLAICPDLVGRERPLEALRTHLNAAATGETRVVALEGEAGVGKTRLARELAQIAQAQGYYVLGGRSYASAPLPYQPFIAALRPYAQARGSEVLRRLLGPLTSELRRLLPELDVPASDDASIPDDERRDRFLRTIHLILEDAASLRPVLLVLDDFHEADTASRELLRHLATTLHGGVTIVFTYRAEDLGTHHPLRALLSDLERERRVVTIALPRLDAAGVRRMTNAMLRERASEALAKAVYEHAEGVPFYVEELVKTALDDPETTPDHLAIPRTVRDSVQLRSARLVEDRGRPALDLLEAAAIANVPLRYDVLLALSSRSGRAAGEDIGAAVDAQLLERTSTQTEIYQFRHALTRDAILSTIGASRRRELSHRVAATLERVAPDVTRAPLLARLFADAGDAAKAIRYAREGAGAAMAVGAYGAAIELLQQATGIAAGRREEADLLEELGIALQSTGRAREAESTLARARDLISDDVRRSRIDLRLGAALRIQGKRAEANEAVRRAIEVLARRPGPLLADALVRRAELAWAEQDPAETEVRASAALEACRRYGAPSGEIEALALLGAASVRLGRPRAIEFLQEGVRLGSDRGLSAETVNAHLELARGLLFSGRNADALGAAERGADLARISGLVFAQAQLLNVATTIAVNLGRYREARGFAEQAVALAPPGTVAAVNAKISLAHVLSDQGDGAGALALLDSVQLQVESIEPERRLIYWSYRAQALLGLRRLDEAWTTVMRAVDTTLATPGLGMTAFLNAAEVAEARRDRAGIEDLALRFNAYFAGRDTPPIRLARMEIDAIKALCEGRGSAASFDAIAETYGALGARVRHAYRRASAAVLALTEPGRRASAKRDLAKWRAELVASGALRYVNALDVNAKGTARRHAIIKGVLDDRQRRVAQLVSRGLTDRRIAAELGVSDTNARNLVRSVIAALGVASRSQVAVWATERERLPA